MHTKGPWDISWGTYQDGEGHEVCEYRKQGQPLACIAKVCFHDDQAGETKANARLIAAAPELLAALRILAEPEKQLELTPMGYAIFRLDVHDLKQIRDAIAKAEGR